MQACQRGQSRRLQGGPWLDAIRALSRLRYSNPQISQLLWDLSDDAIRSLCRDGWSVRAVEALLVPGAGDPTWTAAAVRHHRRQLDLPPYRVGRRSEHWPPALARRRCRAHQEDSGWGALLPRHELTPLECDVLSVLRDLGPLTRRQLLEALGREDRPRPLCRRGWHNGPLARLQAWGLVFVAGRLALCPRRPGRPLYALSEHLGQAKAV